MLVLATAIFTVKTRTTPRGMKVASIIAAGAVVGQIALGAVVIVERLQAILVTAHLGLGMILFSMVLMTVVFAFRLPEERKRAVAAMGRGRD